MRKAHISLPTVFALLITAIYLIFALVGDLTFVSSKLVATSELMSDALQQDNLGSDDTSSFLMTARILNLLPGNMMWWVNLLFGSIAIFCASRHVKSFTGFFVVAMMVAPAIVLYMVRVLKETILTPLFIGVYLIILSRLHRYVKLFFIMFIYLLYGYFIRPYYLLIAGMFVTFYFWTIAIAPVRVIILLASIALIAVLPSEAYVMLQGGAHRGGSAMDYVRTAFANPMEGRNFFEFGVNYLYAILRLNFPIFFTQSALEIFHMVSVGCFAFVYWLGIRSPVWEHRVIALLLLAQVSVLWLFEPDLGSYLRHLSSVFPWAAIVLDRIVLKPRRGRAGMDVPPPPFPSPTPST